MMRRLVILLFFTLTCGIAAAAASERSGVVDVPGGVRLHYVERGSPQAPHTVIFVHGFPDSLGSFDDMLPFLDASVRAIALDQRGFGESSRPACCYAPRDFADDLVTFMDARKIPTATLVGHSFGSFVAQVTALHYPERVNGLVLIGSSTTADNQIVRDFIAASKDQTDPLNRTFVTEFQASTVHTPLPDAKLAKYVDASMKVTARVWMEALTELVKLDTRPDLRRIRARTLIVYGDKDNLFSRAEQDPLVQGIPNATLTVYENVGHSVQWEQPARVAADLMAFLRGDLVSQRE